MLAIRHHAFGPPDVLRPEQLPSRVPHVGTVLPLDQAAEAHRAIEERTSTGTVVLVVER